jgi:RNA polymerase sigma-70 factor (ECF subfamily)
VLRRRLGNREDAEDAVQDAFVGLLRRERRAAFEGDPHAYLARTLRNVAIDVERWRSYHQPNAHVALEDVSEVGDVRDASETLYWREALSKLVDALNELPDASQRVFVLYHVEGQSHAAIAKRLHMSLRSVERHMAHAVSHCEVRLKEYLG